MNVPYAAAFAGNPLQLYPCEGGYNEKFTFAPYEIMWEGYCFNVAWGTPTVGNIIQLYGCNPEHDANDLYHFRGPIATGLPPFECLSVTPFGDVRGSACNGSPSQIWDRYF